MSINYQEFHRRLRNKCIFLVTVFEEHQRNRYAIAPQTFPAIGLLDRLLIKGPSSSYVMVVGRKPLTAAGAVDGGEPGNVPLAKC